MLLRLAALALTSHPPEAPVESLALVTEGCRVRSDQLDLIRPRGPDPAAVDHFDVEVSDGSVLRFCFDWITRSWTIDEIYD